jgi:hypothetical protein
LEVFVSTAVRQLKPRQLAAIEALLAEKTIVDACRACGVPERTLRSWLRLPEFQEAYQAEQRARLDLATAHLQAECVGAVETLRNVHESKEVPASARVAAARAVLELAHKGIEKNEQDQRIEVLERTVAELAELVGVQADESQT